MLCEFHLNLNNIHCLFFTLTFFSFVVMGFKLGALCLRDRLSTTWATLPALTLAFLVKSWIWVKTPRCLYLLLSPLGTRSSCRQAGPSGTYEILQEAMLSGLWAAESSPWDLKEERLGCDFLPQCSVQTAHPAHAKGCTPTWMLWME
jgi:hypothetical protein